MYRFLIFMLFCFATLPASAQDFNASADTLRAQTESLRAPAVPLVVHDPYFSIWSAGDTLNGQMTTHWTGQIHCLTNFVKIDGRNFSVMGKINFFNVPNMTQKSLTILPTRTIYVFEEAGVELTLTFMTPCMMDDLMVYSRPISYITWSVRAVDGKKHDVKIYYDNSAELCVHSIDQPVCGKRMETVTLDILRFGSATQNILARAGDNVRIDWGYQFIASQKDSGAKMCLTDDETARKTFLDFGNVAEVDDTDFPRPCQDRWPVMTCVFDLPTVGETTENRMLMIAYDDEYCLEFLGQKLRPYWRKDGAEVKEILSAAATEYDELSEKCAKFDAKLMADCVARGGEKYAQLCAIAYRQAVGAHKLAVLPNGEMLLVSKEHFSGGFGATVDVLYPTAPIFLYLNNELLKATLTPALEYAQSGRWPFPYAPHDLGYYPQLNGQTYGGGEKSEDRQMPVEESGNMLILLYAAAERDGNADYAARYWEIVTKWAEFLLEKGLDPENQLCTDDFAGHLAHNCNLSVKAIVALACYSRLCEMLGKTEDAQKYRSAAESFAKEWEKMANNGDHYRLAFDQPGTWSMKYNLVWDKLYDLKLFSPEIVKKELAYYKTVQNEYGLPLDNRSDYTKLDWQVWTATLADNRKDFDAIMESVYSFVNATSPRVPMTDWYYSSTAKRCSFTGRSVVGGVFIKMLEK
ncbi:MAG: DUF4965 domain-containing protein [Planctomycetia bacterium]|nr:DUF4965 domain-containing protein [Planctomycetia bacterium]